MGFITSLEQLQRNIEEAFARIEADAIVLHTDLLRIKFVQRGVPLQQQLADLFEMIAQRSAGRTLLFPTFNYDFCQTRVYEPLMDPCQVGTLNEYVRKIYPSHRTLTPVFNFCIYNNRTFSLEPVANPFSETSTFAELARHKSAVLFLGASFAANTFIHYVEEVLDVGYRYIKPFPGVIRRDDLEQQIILLYRVRPQAEGAVEYDWDRLSANLFNSGVLHQSPLGGGKLLWFNADRLLEAWAKRMRKTELYLLTAASKARIKRLYAQYGKPLRYEALEHCKIFTRRY